MRVHARRVPPRTAGRARVVLVEHMPSELRARLRAGSEHLRLPSDRRRGQLGSLERADGCDGRHGQCARELRPGYGLWRRIDVHRRLPGLGETVDRSRPRDMQRARPRHLRLRRGARSVRPARDRLFDAGLLRLPGRLRDAGRAGGNLRPPGGRPLRLLGGRRRFLTACVSGNSSRAAGASGLLEGHPCAIPYP